MHNLRCDLMGWAGATNAAAAVTIGAFCESPPRRHLQLFRSDSDRRHTDFVGGLGLTLAGVFEMLIGK